MEFLYEWIRGIAYYMVLVTVVMQMVGEGYRRYIRMFTGMILVLMILAPVTRLLGDEETIGSWASAEYEQAMAQIEEKLGELEKELEVTADTDASEAWNMDLQSGEEAWNMDLQSGEKAMKDEGEQREAGNIRVEEIQIGW